MAILDYRRCTVAMFGPETARAMWILCGRMVRGKDFREWPVWVKSDSTWMSNELVSRSKKAWILYALATWSFGNPYYRMREHGLGHKWRRTELIPVLKARNPGVRLIALELMAVAGNGQKPRPAEP
jgi:hypothetical protein